MRKGIVPYGKPRRLGGPAKRVLVPKTSSQYRFQHHTNVTYTAGSGHKAIWFGGSSVGSGPDATKVLADAFLCHYLRRVSDNRSSRTETPFQNYFTGTPANSSAVWHFMHVVFGSVGDNPQYTSINFNDAETDTHADDGKGLKLTNASIDTMVPILAEKIEKMYLTRGLVPVRVFMYKDEFLDQNSSYVTTAPRQILDDSDCYRNQFSLMCSAYFKVHNVSVPADGSKDKHAIDANPIDGKLYTFRNRVPIFHPSYLNGLSDAQRNQLALTSRLLETHDADTRSKVDDETGIFYRAIHGDGVSGYTTPNELESPPLRPGVIFKNSTSRQYVRMEPGGFQHKKMYFTTSGSLFSIFKRIAAQPRNDTGNTAYVVPPGGDSFLMCLKPQLKVSNDEVVSIDTETSFTYKAHCRKAKMLMLPTVQEME
jgi:hypothetical protein